MARFADLIGSIAEPTPVPPAETIPEATMGSTHSEVTAALASLAGPPAPPALVPEPDPTDALTAAFGTEAIEPVDFDASINDDLLPARPAKARRR